jgi:large subunit ribosomal protein L25
MQLTSLLGASMNDTMIIKAQSRDKTGKNPAYRLRVKGLVPAVLYGHNFPPIPLSINVAALNAILQPTGRGSGEHVLHKIAIEDRTHIPVKEIMIKELQRDPVTQKILHVDFYTVRMDEKIIVPVRLNITGKAPGVQKGGILQQILREIKIKCFPADIPPSFDVDVSTLEIGQSLHVSDLAIPGHLEIHEDLSAPMVSVIAPTVVKEEAPAPEEVAETPAPAAADKKSADKKESE